MAYQLYKKMCMFDGKKIPPTVISITRTSFSFGSAIGKEFTDSTGFIEIYFDRENNKIGFKPAESRLTGFTAQHKKPGNCAYLVIKPLVEKLPKGRYLATKEDDMWVIEVPEIPEKIYFD